MALLNWGSGLSALGGAVSQTAGSMALTAQKADLENQTAILANQLATTRETALEQQRQTGAAALQASGAGFAAAAAEKQQSFLTAQQKSDITSREAVAEAQRLSSEKIASGEQGIQRAALTPPEIREADWLSKASPEAKQAFRETLLAKAGLPPWMAGDVGGTTPIAPPDTGGAAAGPRPTDTGVGSGSTTIGSSAAPSTTSAAPSTGTAAPSTGAPDLLTGRFDEALKRIPPQAAPTVKAMVEGRLQPPSSMALSRPYWNTMLNLATQVDPAFDQTTWANRVSTRKAFATGPAAQNITQINTALGHAEVVSDTLGKLNNTFTTVVNTPVNLFEDKIMGDARQNNARMAVDALSAETRKIFAANGGGNLTELESWKEDFPINGSPAQQQGAMAHFAHLLDSRLGALSDQYNRGMGLTEDPINLLGAKGASVYQKLTGQTPDNATGYQSGQKPGAAVTAPIPALPAAALQQLKEGTDTTFANGQTWTIKNGQPQQVK